MIQNIPESLKRGVVACIRKAIHEDRPQYLAEFRPNTNNALQRLIGDWINTNIHADLASDQIEIHEFTRGFGWKGQIILDRTNHFTYTIIRRQRLSQIRKDKPTHPHYLESIVSVLNKRFVAPEKQMSFVPVQGDRFDIKTLEDDCDSLLSGCLGHDDDYVHCVIVYEMAEGELSDISVLFLDKHLDVIEEAPLNEFIEPDFAELTNTLTSAVTEEPETKASTGLISIKKRNTREASSENGVVSPARLRENKKQA